jgi:hypothetical protein
MDLQTAENERIIRCYRSAQETLLRDYQRDFPLLKSLHIAAINAFIAYCGELIPQEAAKLISASVKRFHPRALALLGETARADEASILADWDCLFMSYLTKQELTMYLRNGPLVCTADRRRIKKYIRNGIAEILPDAFLLKRDEIYFRHRWKDWCVETSIEMNKSGGYIVQYHQRTYRQDIFDLEDKEKEWFEQKPRLTSIPLPRTMNLHSWLGLGQSMWDIYFEEDEEMMVNRMLQLCRCYIDHLPRLLDGLNIED